jgi:hypothetical protein
MYDSEERPSIQVIGTKLTPESAGVDVTTTEWRNRVGKPNKEMAKRHGVTLSASTGKAPCSQFFYVIDAHSKLVKLRPDLNFKADVTAEYAICNRCGELVLYIDPKSKHIVTSSMTRHMTKHKFPTIAEEMSQQSQ